MAERIKGITIEIDGNATGLDKALKGVNSEIRDTERELKDVNRLLKLDPKNTELLAQKQRLLSKEIKDTEGKLSTLKNAAKDANQALQKGEISQKQYDALQREIIETEHKLNGLQKEAKQTGESMQESGEKARKGFDSEKFKKALAGFGKAAAAAIAAVGAAVGAMMKKFADAAKEVGEYGDHVDKMSQKIGMSAEAYQKWDYIMSQNGASVDMLQGSMKKLATQAQSNSDAFQKLGISQEEVKNLSQEELFDRVIYGLQQMDEGTERTALSTQLLGKSATELAPLLNQSAEETQALGEKAKEYGMIMSDEAVKASAAFTDSLDTLQRTAQGLKNNLVAEFLPAVTQVTDGLSMMFKGDIEGGMASISQGITDFIGKINELMPTVMEIASELIISLVDAILNNLPLLFSTILDVLLKAVNYVVENLGLIIQLALEIIMTLARGLIEALPELIPALVEVILDIVDYLTQPSTIEMLIMVGVELIIALAQGLIKAIPKLVAKVPQIIRNVVQTFTRAIPGAVSQIGARLSSAFNSLVSKAKNWGRDMIQGFVNGIRAKIDTVIAAAKNIADKIKSFLHFSRPDVGPLRDYEKWMPDFVSGLARTLTDSSYILTDAVKNISAEMSVNMIAPNSMTSMLGTYLPMIANQKQAIYLDTGVLVGATAPMYNKQLGRMLRSGV